MFIKAARAVLGVCLILCAANVFAVDYGRTQGQFAVSRTGAATYHLPIFAAPGPNGMTPNISLDYNSQGGNGLAGVGWDLNGISSIERCDRTKNQDGDAAPIDLTMNDRYCLSGNRLRISIGTYGTPGSVYTTEVADFSRITAYGTAGNGPQYFIVEGSDGLKYEYGNSITSRVLLGGTALKWMLSRVSDRAGNGYDLIYNTEGGFAVLDAVYWASIVPGSHQYSYELKFNYLFNRTDADSYIGTIAGYNVYNKYRLSNIQSMGPSLVRRYHLFYDTSAATSRSRLTSVQVCADDPETNCFLPLNFGYQPGQTGVVGTAAIALSSANLVGRGKTRFPSLWHLPDLDYQRGKRNHVDELGFPPGSANRIHGFGWAGNCLATRRFRSAHQGNQAGWVV